MRKKLIGVAALMIAIVATVIINRENDNAIVDDLVLTNVEAMANDLCRNGCVGDPEKSCYCYGEHSNTKDFDWGDDDF